MTEQAVPKRTHAQGHADSEPEGFADLPVVGMYQFAKAAAPAVVLALIVLLIANAFLEGFGHGVRSLAGVLVPLMVLTFLVAYRREYVKSAAEAAPPLAAFVSTLLLGMALMSLVQFSSTLPVTELVLSGSFAVLIGTRVVLRDRSIAYFFGLILGVLAYVVLFGLPNFS